MLLRSGSGPYGSWLRTNIGSSLPERGEGTMRATWHARSSRRSSVRLLRWVARLFVTGGLAALLWCVFVLTDVDNAQQSARETLGTTSRSTESPSTSTPPSGSSKAQSRRLAPGKIGRASCRERG